MLFSLHFASFIRQKERESALCSLLKCLKVWGEILLAGKRIRGGRMCDVLKSVESCENYLKEIREHRHLV